MVTLNGYLHICVIMWISIGGFQVKGQMDRMESAECENTQPPQKRRL